jgi:hypothetical protein
MKTKQLIEKKKKEQTGRVPDKRCQTCGRILLNPNYCHTCLKKL